ncbi:hypothetical protein [Glutamicibacter protophormiae]
MMKMQDLKTVLKTVPHKIWILALCGWALAIIFAGAWIFDLVPYATIWGDVGTWVAAAGTFGGLMYAGLGLRHQVAQRKLEEDRRITEEAEMRLANARKVAVRSKVSHHELLEHPYLGVVEDIWCVEFVVHNSSPFPVDMAVIRVPQFGNSGGFTGEYAELVEGTILPGGQISDYGTSVSKEPPVFAEMLDICEVDFTDTWGKHWRRRPQSLEQRDFPARMC